MEKDETLIRNLTLTKEGVEKYSDELLSCLKIWGLTYTDATMIASLMCEKLILYEENNKPWKAAKPQTTESYQKLAEAIKVGAYGKN